MYMKKVIVVGGGFSGLIAAIHAKNNNNQVMILERNNSCGKKILVTGNGKCNYHNIDQDISHYHTNSSSELDKIINDTNINTMLNFYKSIGIYPKIKNGYYYPYSNQAITVQNCLIRECINKDIEIKTNSYVKDIIFNNNSFIVKTEENDYQADSLIIATGSNAYHKLGSDGNGYSLLKNLNHKIIKVLPALTQLKVSENIKDLSGVRSDVEISLIENNNYIKSELGEVLFTDYGISGICSMQLSSFIARGLDIKNEEKVIINFIPSIAKNKDDFISFTERESSLFNNRQVSEILDSFLNYKVSNFILKRCHIDNNKNWNQLNDIEKDNIINSLISFELNIIDTNSFDNAQVCSGGVSLNEININTMESKIIPGLYIVGELLDVDGDCGGYNITFASITGILAGIGVCNND